ncbi:MAG: serine hydrolase, partial [Spirochaetaceae bacterium]|nr:serine hydrolase [Spirochaetaceae bacterium]
MNETTKHDYISIAETDPGRMGWMQGFPPPQDKILSAADGSFFQFPALRYSVNHMREFLPTREVSANKEKDGIHKFHVKLMKELDTVTFTPWKEANAITWGESLERNFTDGIIILHRGHIVYERYFAGMSPWSHHAAMSVSKSFAGLLASILVAEGKLEEQRTVGSYIPELKDSGFGDATVRQVMDMTTAIQFSEDYNDPNSDIWKLSQAGNVFRPADYSGPGCYYEYLPAIKKDSRHDHGEAFHYRTANTVVLGWLISRVTGKGLAQLLSEMIWRPMGASSDAYY